MLRHVDGIIMIHIILSTYYSYKTLWFFVKQSTYYHYCYYYDEGDVVGAERSFRRAIDGAERGGAKPQRVCSAYLNLCVFLWKLGRQVSVCLSYY